jgi:hypothetical protein
LQKIAIIPNETEKERKYPLENGFKSSSSYVVKFNLPKELKIQYLPKQSTYKDSNISYQIDIKQEANSVMYRFNYQEDYLYLPAETVTAYKKIDENLKETFNESIVLIKK